MNGHHHIKDIVNEYGQKLNAHQKEDVKFIEKIQLRKQELQKYYSDTLHKLNAIEYNTVTRGQLAKQEGKEHGPGSWKLHYETNAEQIVMGNTECDHYQ